MTLVFDEQELFNELDYCSCMQTYALCADIQTSLIGSDAFELIADLDEHGIAVLTCLALRSLNPD